MGKPRFKKDMEGGNKLPEKKTRFLLLGDYLRAYRRQRLCDNTEESAVIGVAPLFAGLNVKEITPLKVLGLLFKPEQGSVRRCDECGEGCCDEQPLNVIPLDALLEKSDENSCGKSSCAACGEDCEIIVLQR